MLPAKRQIHRVLYEKPGYDEIDIKELQAPYLCEKELVDSHLYVMQDVRNRGSDTICRFSTGLELTYNPLLQVCNRARSYMLVGVASLQ